MLKEQITFDGRTEPLVDVEQADMNQNGLLEFRSISRHRRELGIAIAPHNFGSKLGFYAQIHLGLTTPNWLFAEVDDSQVPALKAHGITISGGQAILTGEPGLGVELDESHLEAPLLHLAV